MSRSVRIHEFGGPEVLQIEDVIVPEPASGQVRIRVKAIGLNRTEVTFRTGRSNPNVALPSQMGFEAAGEIDSVGADVKGFAPGDRVAVIPAYGVADYGLYGEISLAPAGSLVKIPDEVSWEEAAAIWVSFATAWTGLIDVGALSAGHVVLVPAASSSVGAAAIQIARRVGAVPIALTRTSSKAKALLELGAAAVVATQEQDLVAEVMRFTDGRGADLVFDPVGGPSFALLATATAIGGKLVIYGALSSEPTPLPILPVIGRQLSVHGCVMTSTTSDDGKLDTFKRFVGEGIASGTFKPTIAKVFPFNEIVEAHRYLVGGEQVGKIVVRV